MGQERRRNDALIEDDEDVLRRPPCCGADRLPRYYAHMAPPTAAAPPRRPLAAGAGGRRRELRERIDAGEWVVDLRDRTAYAAGHLAGSVGIALGQQFSTYLGWLLPWGTPVTLVGESAEQVADAQRQLVRIGIERPAGAAVGRPDELAGGDGLVLPSRDLRRARRDAGAAAGPTVLDVRRDDERAAGAIPGAAHIPLHSLLDRARRRARGRGVGALRVRVPGRHRGEPARPGRTRRRAHRRRVRPRPRAGPGRLGVSTGQPLAPRSAGWRPGSAGPAGSAGGRGASVRASGVAASGGRTGAPG